MLLNLITTSGLLILLHGVISLPDASACDKEKAHLDSFKKFVQEHYQSVKQFGSRSEPTF